MYVQERIKQLQNKSHVRGALSKEFYSLEKEEKEGKRREMKAILDNQIEQKRRLKIMEKQNNKHKITEEDQREPYYHRVQPKYQRSQDRIQVRQTVENQISRPKLKSNNDYSRRQVLNLYAEEIPVMEVQQEIEISTNEPVIPVLQFKDEKSNIKSKQNTNAPLKTQSQEIRNSTKRLPMQTESHEKMNIKQQNLRLKQELRKSQQAIANMVKILRSNPKLQKYLVEVDRILKTTQNKQPIQQSENKYFPSLKFNKNSIIEQYILQSALKAKKANVNSKTT